jgi:hypothetical protein
LKIGRLQEAENHSCEFCWKFLERVAERHDVGWGVLMIYAFYRAYDGVWKVLTCLMRKCGGCGIVVAGCRLLMVVEGRKRIGW